MVLIFRIHVPCCFPGKKRNMNHPESPGKEKFGMTHVVAE